jgi:hypothetical protein
MIDHLGCPSGDVATSAAVHIQVFASLSVREAMRDVEAGHHG